MKYDKFSGIYVTGRVGNPDIVIQRVRKGIASKSYAREPGKLLHTYKCDVLILT